MPNQAWRLVPIAAALLAAATAVPALADDWDTCAKASGDDAIAACSRAIKSGTYNGKTLALAYSNRGVEWRAKGELARAIADYDEAIKADPQQRPTTIAASPMRPATISKKPSPTTTKRSSSSPTTHRR
jgi:tetratricopeptide (TPR) repeat protein